MNYMYLSMVFADIHFKLTVKCKRVPPELLSACERLSPF